MSRTCVTVLGLVGSGRPLVDPQVSLDDLYCDRRRGVGAEATAFDDDADGYLRIVGWRETGEDRVVEARAVNTILRRARLAGDLDAGDRRVRGADRGSGRVRGHLDHHLGDLAGNLRADRLGHQQLGS